MIGDKNGIAAVDAAQLVDLEQRKMADTARVAQLPMKLKKTVSASIHHPFAAYMRKTFHFKP